jgi:hypothetical protein
MAITKEKVGDRFPKELDQVLLSFLGLQTESIIPEMAFDTKIYNRSAQKGEARSIFTQELKFSRKKVSDNKLSKEEALDRVKKAYDICARNTEPLCDALLRDVNHARKLGLTDQQIATSMKEKSFTNYEIKMILAGKPFIPLFKGYNK